MKDLATALMSAMMGGSCKEAGELQVDERRVE